MTASPLSLKRRRRAISVAGAAVIILLVAAFSAPAVLGWWYGRRADQAAEAGDLETAMQLAERSVRYQSQDPEAVLQLGSLQRRVGRVDLAARTLERAGRLGADADAVALQQTLLRVQAGHLADPRPLVSEVLKGRPDDHTAEQVYEALAQGYLFSGRSNEAVDCLNYWLDWQPENFRARSWRAELAERRGRSEEALRDYEQLVTMRPDDRRIRDRYASCLLNAGKPDKALVEYQSLYESQSDENAHLGMAKSLEMLGRSEEAIVLYEEVLSARPAEEVLTHTRLGLGKCLLFTNHPSEAIPHLEAALEADPSLVDGADFLATAYRMQGNPDQAERWQQRALEQKQLQAQFAQDMEKVGLSPFDGDLRLRVGENLLRQGQGEAALAWWRAAVDIVPRHRGLLERLVSYLHSVGKPELAAPYEAALSTMPAASQDDIATSASGEQDE